MGSSSTPSHTLLHASVHVHCNPSVVSVHPLLRGPEFDASGYIHLPDTSLIGTATLTTVTASHQKSIPPHTCAPSHLLLESLHSPGSTSTPPPHT